jgi:hypothetical protein
MRMDENKLRGIIRDEIKKLDEVSGADAFSQGLTGSLGVSPDMIPMILSAVGAVVGGYLGKTVWEKLSPAVARALNNLKK